MKDKIFDEEAIKYIFCTVKTDKKAVEDPLKIKSAGSQFCLWMKHVRKLVSDGEENAENTYYLNIQTAKKFDESVQDEKLGLEITEDGHVLSVMVDGKHIPASTYTSVIYDCGVWNSRLVAIMKKLLEDKGVQSEGSALIVNQLAIKKVPDLLIRKWAKLPDQPRSITYLDCMLCPVPTSHSNAEQDCMARFYSDVLSSLLDGSLGRPVGLDSNGCPFVRAGEGLNDDCAKALGRLLSAIVEIERPVTAMLSVRFLRLISVAARAPKAEERSRCAATALADPDLEAIAAWLGGDDAREHDALRVISENGHAAGGGAPSQSTAALRARAAKHLQDATAPYMRLAAAVYRGLSPALADRVKAEPVDSVFAGFMRPTAENLPDFQRRPSIPPDVIAAVLGCAAAAHRILTALAGTAAGTLELRRALGFRAACRAWERAVTTAGTPVEVPACDAVSARFLARFPRVVFGGDADGAWLPALRDALALRRGMTVSVLRWSGEVGALAAALDDLRGCAAAVCAECAAARPTAACACGGAWGRLAGG